MVLDPKRGVPRSSEMLVETLKAGSRAIHDTNLYKVGDPSLEHNALPGPFIFKRITIFESPSP